MISERTRSITLRFLAEPIDMNLYGRVHGGAVMKWIDQAGYACAVGWSGQYCVTVYVGGIQFYKPVHIGHIVEVNAKLIYTGRTSMHIAVDVRAADPRDGLFSRTTRCVVVFVAIDAQTRPTEVPAWQPTTPRDIELQQYAVKLMDLRKTIEAEMSRQD